MNVIQTYDKYYLAGLLDGEGYFGVSPNFYPVVKVEMCHEEAVNLIHTITGIGNVYHRNPRKEGYKHSWQWQVKGQEAANLCIDLHPFMVVKKIQSLILGQLGQNIALSLGKPTPFDMEYRRYTHNLIKEINAL